MARHSRTPGIATSKSRTRTHWRTVFGLVLGALALGASLTEAASGSAPSADRKATVLEHVRSSRSLEHVDLEVSYRETFELPLTGKRYELFKVIDRQTGAGYSVGLDDEGHLVDISSLKADERREHRQEYGKLHPALFEKASATRSDEILRVSIWVAADEVDLSRPSLDETRKMSRTALDQERSRARLQGSADIAAAVEPTVQFLEARGIRVQRDSFAPMIVADLSRSTLAELERRPEIVAIDLVVPAKPDAEAVSAGSGGGSRADTGGDTHKVDALASRGITGAGIRLAVVEPGSVSPDNPYLNEAEHYRGLAEIPVSPHATAVAGFMSSDHPTVRGTAPGVDPVLSGNGGNPENGLLWAYGQAAQGFNNSYSMETDGAMHNSDRWADWVVISTRSLFVKSAGNRGDDDGRVTSPGLGYNVLTVGATADQNTTDWDDDEMASFSSWVAPAGRNKPEIVAVGCADDFEGMQGLTIASPWTGDVGCGTSFAAPAVTGMIGTLLERDAALGLWPEAIKAIAIASALHNIEGSSRLSSKDGAGAIDLAAADFIAANGWWTARSVSGATFTDGLYTLATIELDADERFRAALTFDGIPENDYASEVLPGDLDLYLYDAGDNLVAWSAGVDSWEIIDWTVTTSGTYTLRVRNYADSLSRQTFIGAAWFPGHDVIDVDVQTRPQPNGARDHLRVDTDGTPRWTAVAMRPPDGSNYNLDVLNVSRYDNPADIRVVGRSTYGGDIVDLVVFDGNHAPAQSYYPIVSTVHGSGDYKIQQAIPHGEVTNGWDLHSTLPGFVASVRDVHLTAGEEKHFKLVPIGEGADLGMLLFDSNPGNGSTWTQGRWQAVAGSDSAGPGGVENLSYTTGTDDELGLVIFNRNGQTQQSSWFIYVDDSAPTGSVTIEGGQDSASSALVTLDLSASDPDTGIESMRFANEDGVWSDWAPYETARAWALDPAPGVRTVFAQFRNRAGIESPVYSDDIVLCGQPGDCVDLEDQTLDSTFHVGDDFTSGGVTVSLDTFHWSSSTSTDEGVAWISDRNTVGGGGKQLELNNINAGFLFGRTLEGATVRYSNLGGILNLSINGDRRLVLSFEELDGQTVGGVQVRNTWLGSWQGQLTLTGPMYGFQIGGQEFAVDDICPFGSPALRFMKIGADTFLTWDEPSLVDIVSGDLGGLAVNGDFTLALQQCEANDHPGTSLVVNHIPERGEVTWFLARRSDTGGTYDSGGSAQVGGRDSGISGSGLACAASECQLGAPDLVVRSIEVTTECAELACQAVIRAVIANDGDLPSPGGFTTSLGVESYPGQPVASGGLAVGQTQELTVPLPPECQSDCTVCAYVDSEYAVPESDETNNERCAPVLS